MKQEYRDLLEQDVKQQRYRDLLYIDLCGRIPYNVVMNCTEDDDEKTNFNCYLTPDMLNDIRSIGAKWNYKPYLRKFEDMTEEESREFALWQVEAANSGYLFPANAGNCVDWLNKHYIDYRGMIDKDLAIRAVEGFYIW